MGLRLVDVVAVEPVTLGEARQHLHIDGVDHDAKLAICISAARGLAEHTTGRALVSQTWELVLDAFPAGAIQLPKPPIQSIDFVKYYDAAGVLTTVDPQDYTLDDAQLLPWLLPTYGTQWPSTLDMANSVIVRFQCGYDDCPASVKAWILLKVGDLFENRESTNVGSSATPLGFADELITANRIFGL